MSPNRSKDEKLGHGEQVTEVGGKGAGNAEVTQVGRKGAGHAEEGGIGTGEQGEGGGGEKYGGRRKIE